MRAEDRIRDRLSQNLAVIEQGLRLVETEHHLSNPSGADGFVDILARDKTGLLVVIEIKRSDKSAREAMHELYKYTALLLNNQGLDHTQVRCVLVSTSWRELLVPFSSFVRNVEYHVDGYCLEVDTGGNPTAATPVTPVPEGQARELSPHCMIYLYEKRARRERNKDELERLLSDTGVHDYCIVELDGERDIPYPFALYLALDAIDNQTRYEIERKHSPRMEDLPESDKWRFERAVLIGINGNFVGHCDSAEIGYPEKFAHSLRRWEIRAIHRAGRIAESALLAEDEDLIGELAGKGGGHSSLYTSIATPRYKSAWRSKLEKSRYALLGNDYWQGGLDWFLRTIERERERATVSISVYNPGNIMFSLYYYAALDDFSYLPFLEVVVDDPEKGEVVVLTGRVEWDGETSPSTPQAIVNEYFRDDFDFFLTVHLREQWMYDPDMMAGHGLRYALLETSMRREGKPVFRRLSFGDGSWKIDDEPARPNPGVQEFVGSNRRYVAELARFILATVSGA
jgi:hypothetical protein